MKSSILLRVLVSIFMIGVGVLALLVNLGMIDVPWTISGGGIVWLVLFTLSGLAFLGIFIRSAENWWAVIPGLTLIGLGVVISDMFPKAYQHLSVVILLALLGFGFLGAFLANRGYWGLVIPGGVLLAAAAQFLVANSDFREYSSAVLLLGFGATLLVAYLLTSPKMKWLLVVAACCGYLSIVAGAGALANVSLLMPGALILIGGIIIWRAFHRSARA